MFEIIEQSNKDIRDVKKSFAKICLFIVVLFFLHSCATTSDIENLKTDIRNTRIATLHQQKDISELKERVTQLSGEINALKEAAVKEQAFGAVKESQMSALQQISELNAELQTIKGRLDESKHASDKTMKDFLTERELQNAKIAAIEKELAELKKVTGVQAEPKKEAPAEQKPPKDSVTPPETKAAEKPEAKDPQKIFEAAQVDFKEKRYAQARQGYERLIKEFPKHQQAPASQFWIAETYFAERKYEDAILSYENFIKKYRTNDKVRTAMLKQGYSFIELGDKKTGKVILEKLIEKYPRSTETELAKKKLAEILPKKKR
jgi:tol-pal system protein YbgF